MARLRHDEREKRHVRREEHRGADALQGAPEEYGADAGGKGARERRQPREPHAREEDAPLADAVGDAAERQQADDVREQVAREDPGEQLRRRGELAADVRQRERQRARGKRRDEGRRHDGGQDLLLFGHGGSLLVGTEDVYKATCTNVRFVDIAHRPYSQSHQSRCACGLRSWGFT